MLRQEFGLVRYEGNPIISPKDVLGAEATFNCGQTMYKGKTILLVAVAMKDTNDARMHVAESDDGINFTIRKEPFITRSTVPHIRRLDTWPVDPRITYMPEEDVYYIMRPGNSNAGCVAFLGKTKDFVTYEDIDVIALPNNRVPCLFPKKINGMYVRLDRPYAMSDNSLPGSIWLQESPNLIHWGKPRLVAMPWCYWNRTKIGPTPPIETEDGWLVIIHGVIDMRYSLGAILLDKECPEKVIGHTKGYLLTPDTDYEFNGWVPNVVFSCGAIADFEQDRLRVYYGASDTCIGLATGKLSEIIDLCKAGGPLPIQEEYI